MFFADLGFIKEDIVNWLDFVLFLRIFNNKLRSLVILITV